MSGLDQSLIAPVKMRALRGWVAKRPRNSSLCIDKIRKEIEIEPLA